MYLASNTPETQAKIKEAAFWCRHVHLHIWACAEYLVVVVTLNMLLLEAKFTVMYTCSLLQHRICYFRGIEHFPGEQTSQLV